VKEGLSKLSIFLILAGLISSVLYLAHMNLRILMWIDEWGPDVGWMIRGGILAAGVALWVLSGRMDPD
jgi:hypothetical protein